MMCEISGSIVRWSDFTEAVGGRETFFKKGVDFLLMIVYNNGAN